MVTVMMVTQSSCPTQCTPSSRLKVTVIAFVWLLSGAICCPFCICRMVTGMLARDRQTDYNRLQRNMQKSQTNFLAYRFLIAIGHSTENMLKIGRGVLTCVAALSQLSTSAAPPDRELPRSLPPTRITRALSRAHKAHSP